MPRGLKFQLGQARYVGTILPRFDSLHTVCEVLKFLTITERTHVSKIKLDRLVTLSVVFPKTGDTGEQPSLCDLELPGLRSFTVSYAGRKLPCFQRLQLRPVTKADPRRPYECLAVELTNREYLQTTKSYKTPNPVKYGTVQDGLENTDFFFVKCARDLALQGVPQSVIYRCKFTELVRLVWRLTVEERNIPASEICKPFIAPRLTKLVIDILANNTTLPPFWCVRRPVEVNLSLRSPVVNLDRFASESRFYHQHDYMLALYIHRPAELIEQHPTASFVFKPHLWRRIMRKTRRVRLSGFEMPFLDKHHDDLEDPDRFPVADPRWFPNGTQRSLHLEPYIRHKPTTLDGVLTVHIPQLELPWEHPPEDYYRNADIYGIYPIFSKEARGTYHTLNVCLSAYPSAYTFKMSPSFETYKVNGTELAELHFPFTHDLTLGRPPPCRVSRSTEIVWSDGSKTEGVGRFVYKREFKTEPIASHLSFTRTFPDMEVVVGYKYARKRDARLCYASLMKDHEARLQNPSVYWSEPGENTTTFKYIYTPV